MIGTFCNIFSSSTINHIIFKTLCIYPCLSSLSIIIVPCIIFLKSTTFILILHHFFYIFFYILYNVFILYIIFL